MLVPQPKREGLKCHWQACRFSCWTRCQYCELCSDLSVNCQRDFFALSLWDLVLPLVTAVITVSQDLPKIHRTLWLANQYVPIFICCMFSQCSHVKSLCSDHSIFFFFFFPAVPTLDTLTFSIPQHHLILLTSCDPISSVNPFSLNAHLFSSLLEMLHSSWRRSQCPTSVFLVNSTLHTSQWIVPRVVILSRKKAGNPFLSEAGSCAPSLPTVGGESVRALLNLFPQLRLWAQSCPQCPGWPQISLGGCWLKCPGKGGKIPNKGRSIGWRGAGLECPGSRKEGLLFSGWMDSIQVSDTMWLNLKIGGRGLLEEAGWEPCQMRRDCRNQF